MLSFALTPNERTACELACALLALWICVVVTKPIPNPASAAAMSAQRTQITEICVHERVQQLKDLVLILDLVLLSFLFFTFNLSNKASLVFVS